MNPRGVIGWLVIGAISGWVAGQIMKGRGFGLLGNIIVGIVGAAVGGWIFSALGESTSDGFLGSIVTSVIGAVVLLFLIGMIRRT